MDYSILTLHRTIKDESQKLWSNAMDFVYAQGALVGCDKDWFHGELSTVQAEHALTVSACDCFLVRVSQGALILSLLHHGQVHHLNIHYGPGWYELESGSAQYSFTELEELVSHYRETAISDSLNITLGAVCEKNGRTRGFSCRHNISRGLPHSYETIPETTPHHYDYISNDTYSKEEPEGLAKYKWYHGKITRDEADAALSIGCGNMFLVWHSSDELTLSTRYQGRIFHIVIKHSPIGYQLEGKSELFHTIFGMIAYYQQYLGKPIETVPKGSQLKTSTYTATAFRKEVESLQINWRRCADLPVACASPRVVKIGEDIYAGGGMAARNAVMVDRVFKYNTSQDVWTPLPPCNTCDHSLTTLNSELIVIGGMTRNSLATNAVRTFRDGEWKAVLPPMPTPRWNFSAVSHDNRIVVVAGGITQVKNNGEKEKTDRVELYITDTNTWYSTKKLPFPLSQFTTCIIDGTCYTLGGTTSQSQLNMMLYATVSSLLQNAVPADSTYSTPVISITWKQVKDKHPLIYSSPVELDGRLFAVGGSAELRLRHGTTFISTYDFATDTWVKCKGADLPTPLYRPGVLKLDHHRVMIVGGQPKMQQFSAAVYIGSYCSDFL